MVMTISTENFSKIQHISISAYYSNGFTHYLTYSIRQCVQSWNRISHKTSDTLPKGLMKINCRTLQKVLKRNNAQHSSSTIDHRQRLDMTTTQ